MNYWELFTIEGPKVSKKSLSLSTVFLMRHCVTLKKSPYTKNVKAVHSETCRADEELLDTC